MANANNHDWVAMRAEYEAGTPVAKTALKHGVSRTAIYLHKAAESWTPSAVAIKDKLVENKTGITAASVPNGDASNGSGIKTIGKGRSIGQPIGDEGKDLELLPKFRALAGLSAPEQTAVNDQAATEIELMRQHRQVIGRASVVAENILTRLHALVVEGTAADVITFQTKKGEAFHRVPFLGDRESVSDALLKCANAISKLIPMERQAHGLRDKDVATQLPQVIFNMPNIRVISVDGKGKVVSTEDRPALINQ